MRSSSDKQNEVCAFLYIIQKSLWIFQSVNMIYDLRETHAKLDDLCFLELCGLFQEQFLAGTKCAKPSRHFRALFIFLPDFVPSSTDPKMMCDFASTNGHGDHLSHANNNNNCPIVNGKDHHRHSDPVPGTALPQETDSKMDMSAEDFKKFGHSMLDFIADYFTTIRDRPPTAQVTPGYMSKLLPKGPPETGEPWENIMRDLEPVIMRGLVHWSSPQFHAYYPANSSYSTIIADMLSAAVNCIGFAWSASPACTELEIITMDWLGQLVGLDDGFNCQKTGGRACGMIQSSACESTLMTLLAARNRAVKQLMSNNRNMTEHDALSKLVMFASDQAHYSVEKAAKTVCVKIVQIKSQDFRVGSDQLTKCVEEVKSNGMVPFYMACTLGTPGTCSFDKLSEIGPICRSNGMWLHVDAAYAGAGFICEESRHLLNGIEYANSFVFNLHKWMFVNHECSALWVRDFAALERSCFLEPEYTKNSESSNTMNGGMPFKINGFFNEEQDPEAVYKKDFRHTQVAMSRRFRSLKIWFLLRVHGVNKIKSLIRDQISLARMLGGFLERDGRFELMEQIHCAFLCFRVTGDLSGHGRQNQNRLNAVLLKEINKRGRIFMNHACPNGHYVLRFAVNSRLCEQMDIKIAFNEITAALDHVLAHSDLYDLSRPDSTDVSSRIHLDI